VGDGQLVAYDVTCEASMHSVIWFVRFWLHDVLLTLPGGRLDDLSIDSPDLESAARALAEAAIQDSLRTLKHDENQGEPTGNPRLRKFREVPRHKKD
jgi:hypothetical protein